MIFRKARPLAAAIRAAAVRLVRTPSPRHEDQVEAAPSGGEGGDEAEHTDQQQPTAPPYEGEIQTNHASSGTAQQQREAKSTEGDPYLRTQVRQNWVMVSATVVIAVAACITTVIGVYQWKSIQDQLAAGKETSKQTQQLIQATQDLATHSAETANAATNQAQFMEQLAGATKTSAGASLESAQLAAQGSRPYLRADFAFLGGDQNRRDFYIRFANGGNSPAVDVRVEYDIRLGGLVGRNLKGSFQPFSVYPSQPETVRLTTSLTQKEIEAIEQLKIPATVRVSGSYASGASGRRFPLPYFCKMYDSANFSGFVRPCESTTPMTRRRRHH
jgi:uncharacterized membrane-anchored protein YhcB (DUF1043 family)